MALREFKCPMCGEKSERILLTIRDDEARTCPHCGFFPMRELISAPAKTPSLWKP